jgi:hypothetical protein
MKQIILLFLIAALLTACATPGETSSSGVNAWVDQPVTGAVLPVGAFTLKAHARHVSGSGVNKIEFLVNGVSVGAVDTDASAPLAYAEMAWNASAPGEYTLVARAYAGSESSDSAPVRVCVSQDAKEAALSQSGGCNLPEKPPAPAEGNAATESLPPDKATEVAGLTETAMAPTPIPPTAVLPTETFTPIPPTFTFVPPTFTPVPPTFTRVPPTATPFVDRTNPVVTITLIQPTTLYYGSGCSASSGILTVEAYVTDESGVGNVELIYGFVGAGTEGISTLMTPIGGGYYRAIVDIGAQAYTFFQGANGEIAITVIGYDLAGNSAYSSSNVPLLFCPG